MDALAVFTAALALLGGFVIGSLPLGGRVVALLSGQSPAETSAHNLGVENLLRFVGVPAAVVSFLLDALKGLLALALFGGSPWAAFGVYAGHLYPLPRWRGELPRGRGNGVLLGLLAGLWAVVGVPFWLTALPVAVYAALLALSGFVALATTGGLVVLPLLALGVAEGARNAVLAALLLVVLFGLWRHKVSLVRIVDRTEPRIWEPPPVRGVDPGVVYAAFMIHPLTLEDLWQAPSLRPFGALARRGLLPEALIRLSVRWLRPQKRGEISGIRLSDGRELRVMLIGGPMLPDQIRRYPDEAVRMAIQGARLAFELGAEAFGLGAFWSTVGNKGQAVPGILEGFRASGRDLKRATAAVVGANGVVAFGVARTVAPHVARLILIGRDEARLTRSARTLRRKFPQTQFEVSTDVARCRAAALVFSATSDPNPVIRPEHVAPGTWLFDLGRPADVDESVRALPGVRLIPGGVVRPPGRMRSSLDLHFGDGLVPACLAETMIMTASRAFGRKSLGERTREADITFYVEEGARLGFEVVTEDVTQPARTAAARDERALEAV